MTRNVRMAIGMDKDPRTNTSNGLAQNAAYNSALELVK